MKLNNTHFKIEHNFSKNKCENRMPRINKISGELVSDERPDLSTENWFKI